MEVALDGVQNTEYLLTPSWTLCTFWVLYFVHACGLEPETLPSVGWMHTMHWVKPRPCSR